MYQAGHIDQATGAMSATGRSARRRWDVRHDGIPITSGRMFGGNSGRRAVSGTAAEPVDAWAAPAPSRRPAGLAGDGIATRTGSRTLGRLRMRAPMLDGPGRFGRCTLRRFGAGPFCSLTCHLTVPY